MVERPLALIKVEIDLKADTLLLEAQVEAERIVTTMNRRLGQWRRRREEQPEKQQEKQSCH